MLYFGGGEGEVIIVFLLISISFPFWKWISVIVVYKAFRKILENMRNKSLVYAVCKRRNKRGGPSFFFVLFFFGACPRVSGCMCMGDIILKHQSHELSVSSEL